MRTGDKRHASLLPLARYSRMTDKTTYDEPSDVEAEEGDVIVKGPDSVDVRMTPSAAVATSDRLLHGSMKAQGQRVRSPKSA